MSSSVSQKIIAKAVKLKKKTDNETNREYTVFNDLWNPSN